MELFGVYLEGAVKANSSKKARGYKEQQLRRTLYERPIRTLRKSIHDKLSTLTDERNMHIVLKRTFNKYLKIIKEKLCSQYVLNFDVSIDVMFSSYYLDTDIAYATRSLSSYNITEMNTLDFENTANVTSLISILKEVYLYFNEDYNSASIFDYFGEDKIIYDIIYSSNNIKKQLPIIEKICKVFSSIFTVYAIRVSYNSDICEIVKVDNEFKLDKFIRCPCEYGICDCSEADLTELGSHRVREFDYYDVLIRPTYNDM